MSGLKKHADRWLFISAGILIASGVGVFASGAFGLLARGETHISSVVFNHTVLGVGLGIVVLFITSIIDYKRWKRFALPLFIFSIVLTALVFVPDIGITHGGGTRWIDLGFLSFQPSETMKIGAVLFAAVYFSSIRQRVATIQYGVVGLLGVLALPTLLLVLQPDIGTLGIIVVSVGAIYVAAGARMRDVVLVALIGVLLIGALALTRPYVKDRLLTFINPADNPQTEGYQIRQSLIAIGSGGVSGRGFGQGIQKFTYLPEPMGDSIFAVAAEEFGFFGSVFVVGTFLVFALRGFTVASRAGDSFGTLLGVGIVSYLVAEAFINIAGMVGLIPLTGVPLTFFSQGGTAMLVSLGSVGILLSISKRVAHS
ncbi:MAG TPA: putative peptidoglycan glycosyltransferase FtsW [Candidatus Paceibacterota bacterium]